MKRPCAAPFILVFFSTGSTGTSAAASLRTGCGDTWTSTTGKCCLPAQWQRSGRHSHLHITQDSVVLSISDRRTLCTVLFMLIFGAMDLQSSMWMQISFCCSPSRHVSTCCCNFVHHGSICIQDLNFFSCLFFTSRLPHTRSCLQCSILNFALFMCAIRWNYLYVVKNLSAVGLWGQY